MNKRLKRILIFVFVLYFILQFFSLSFQKKENLVLHERVVVAVTAPAQWVVRSLMKAVQNTVSNYFFLVGTKQENFELKKRISSLEHKLIDFQELEQENLRLKTFLNMDVEDDYVRVVAQKIASGSSRFEQAIRIQKGSRHGIRVGQPVLNAQGIVGQVIETYRSYSDVLLITDPTSSIDVVIQRSRANGMLKGGRINQLLFEFLSKEADIFEEDVVITSGLDGIYPKAMPIGKVSAVGVRGKGLFLEATVKPFVAFQDIEEVIVLLPKVGQR